MNEDDFKSKLAPEQYRILRQKGTEPPFSGKLLNEKRSGVFACMACGNELFSSDTKYESGSGWPSFYDALSKDTIALEEDSSMSMQRIEVKCAKCGSHLGHVFDDGPSITGKRYCINSLALDFQQKKTSQ